MATPIKSANDISRKPVVTAIVIALPVSPTKWEAIARAKPKIIMATPLLMATTVMSVDVSGPDALSSRVTCNIVAGAVAMAIEPKRIARMK